MNDELPARPWELPAPESLVLLWGPETGNAWALKVALLELIARGALRLVAVEHRRLLLFPTVTTVLALGPNADRPASRSLRVVLDSYPKPRTYPDGTVGVPLETLAGAVFAQYRRRVRLRFGRFRWDSPSGGYVQSEVLPELERRGLYRRDSSSRLGLFDTTRWVLTPAGTAALEELRALTTNGRTSFAGWVQHDPEAARAYVERAGTSLLLMGGLGPSLRRLQQTAPEREEAGVKVGALSLAVLAGSFGPGPADGLDAAFDAISVGVDSAWDALLRGTDGGGE
jgi:hypothetical protein